METVSWSLAEADTHNQGQAGIGAMQSRHAADKIHRHQLCHLLESLDKHRIAFVLFRDFPGSITSNP